MTIKARTRRETFARVLSIGGALVTVAGMAYLFLTPKIFMASAMIKVSKRGLAQNNPAGVVSNPKLLLAAECEFMRSDPILDSVIEHLRLNELWEQRYNQASTLDIGQSRARLQMMTDIHPLPDSEIVQIRVASKDREEPARIANEIVHAYSEQLEARRQKDSREKINLLRQQWEAQSAKVAQAETALEKLRQEIRDERATNTAKLYDPKSYDLLQGKRVELEMDYVKQKSALDQYAGMDRKKLTQVMSLSDETTNSLLIGYLTQLNRAESGLITAQNDHGPNSPEVVAANLAVGKLRKNVDDAVNGIMFGLNENLVSLKASLDELGQKLKNSTTNSSQITDQDSAYAGASQKLETLKNERDMLQEKLVQQNDVEVWAIMHSMPDILAHAEPPTQPASPYRRAATNVIVTGCFAVMAGLLLLVSAPKPRAAPTKA